MSPHNATHNLMIVLRVDQSINQSDNYIMTVHYDQVHQKRMSRNVKNAVMSNPVDDTQYIKNRSLLKIINKIQLDTDLS